MKPLFVLIFIATTLRYYSQPTGHQKIFLEITDNADTLDFNRSFRKNQLKSKPSLWYKNYQLKDIGSYSTGFQKYPSNPYFHKKLMTKNHTIEIIKNKKDTMHIEINNAFKVYFLSISFQKGNYKINLNDNSLNDDFISSKPSELLKTEQFFINITPKDWNKFKVNTRTSLND